MSIIKNIVKGVIMAIGFTAQLVKMTITAFVFCTAFIAGIISHIHHDPLKGNKEA